MGKGVSTWKTWVAFFFSDKKHNTDGTLKYIQTQNVHAAKIWGRVIIKIHLGG